MRCVAFVAATLAVICSSETAAQSEIRDALTYNTILIKIAGRDYIATADVFGYWNGAREYSAVVVFPEPRYVVHNMWVEHGTTIFRAYGHTHRIRGRRIALTDHTAAWLKVLPGELPIAAYRSSEALKAAVTKQLAHVKPW